MQKITPFLWFDKNAEDAANFYTSVFKNSKINNIVRYNEAGAAATGMPEGTAMTVAFELEGQKFTALNGGPHFKLNPSISFFVNCETEDEVKKLWDKLSPGGKILMPLDKYFFSDKYGWIQDKYGLSWQLIKSQGDFSQKIVASMLFVGDVCGKVEEAINFYTIVFNDSKVKTIFRYEAGMEPEKEGNIAFSDFILEGQIFAAMESAREHEFSFNEAVSFVVNCDDQKEVDYYWDKLSAVPEAEQCAWLKDKYGISWQIVPSALPKFLSDSDPEKSQRVMQAMLKMKKIVIEDLKKAYEAKN